MKKMTEGSAARLIVAFAIPMLIGNVFQQLYSMADMFIVGHTISTEALGAIGCTGSISMLLIHFSQGLTGGFCILTARYFGADDEKNVRKSFATGLFLSFGCILLLTAAALVFLKPFLQLIKTREELFDDAHAYIQIVVAGIGATVLYNYFAGILRAFGDSRSPLYVLIIASLVNVGLDYLLILVFRMGVRGAALATVTSQLLSAVLCLLLILKKLPVLRLGKEDLRIEGQAVKQHLAVGVPMAFQWSLISIGQIVMQSALNQLSTDAVTAFSAASKIDLFALMPSMSFSSAMTAYVPQNYGARDPKRIREGVRTCCLIAGSFCMTVGIVNFIFGGTFASFFIGSGKKELIDLAQRYLRITGPCYFLHALLMIYRNSAQGLGRTFSPVLSGIMELLMRFLTAFVLVPFFGFTGACFSSPLSWIAAGIPLAVSYYTGLKQFEKQLKKAG